MTDETDDALLLPMKPKPVWYRFAVKEVRFLTGYVLTEEPVERREDLLKAVQRMTEDFAYRERNKADCWPDASIECWIRNTIDLFQEALESGDFRRFESSPMGKYQPVGLIVEDTA